MRTRRPTRSSSCASSAAALACALAAFFALAASAGPATTTAVEFYHAGYGHYFATASEQEIGKLDAGTPPGWSRTGESFGVFDIGVPGAAAVCRFWTAQRFAPKSSHFYSPVNVECATVKQNPDWVYEGDVFAWSLPDATGACPIGLLPLYRMYNNGKSGAPNHRYTTHAAIRTQMLAQGWIAEGAGIGVIGCVPPAPVTIVAAGDIAQCHGGPAAASGAARTAKLVAPQDGLVLTLGDHAYEYGTPEEYANCFDPTWGAFKSRIRPAPGNHDYYTDGAAGYFGYFGVQAGPDRRGYYSFDYAGWHFIALNSLTDVSAASVQYEWLQADLAKSAGTACTIAFWHYPAFNSGASYGSVLEMRPFFAALDAAGAEIVLSGHEHIYERFAPQNADGTPDPERGVRQFVVGTGGHTLNQMGPGIPNSEYRQNTSMGVLRLTLGEGRYTWQFLPVDGGAPLDAGSGTCHN